MSPRTSHSGLIVGAAVLAALVTTVATRMAYDGLHPCNVPNGLAIAHGDPVPPVNSDTLRPHWSPNGMDWGFGNGRGVEYLAYKGDGTVWVLWPDGRFIEVVPK